MRLFHSFIAFCHAQRRYFSESRLEIARDNLMLMKIAGAVGSIIAVFFFLVTPLIIPTWSITREYLYILPILLAAFLFSFFYSRRKAPLKPRTVEIASALFYILLLADFIALSVFPYPTAPQIFISLCYMFMPALMIQRPVVLLGIMAVGESVFLALAAQYKTSVSVGNDVFNTMAALLFSLIIMGTTNRLRCRDYAARAKLEYLSQTDALTGLLNKKTFEDLGSARLHNHGAATGVALLILDLDEFKLVNDRWGHPVGDALLHASGELLRRTFRQGDLAGRIGGDEFAVMLCGTADAALLREKCLALQGRFAALSVEDAALQPSCSIGVAVSSDMHITYPELFRAADEALYDVKRNNRGGLAIRSCP